MDILLAPDVLVNASVALGSPPEQVVQRVLGKGKGKTSDWVLERVRAMLSGVPAFKGDAVEGQLDTIKGLVEAVELDQEYGPDAWEEALVATAKASDIARVVTDHPDLLEMGESDGIEFVSTEAWLVEVTMPPPAPE